MRWLVLVAAACALSCGGGAGNTTTADTTSESEPLMNVVEAPTAGDKPDLCIDLTARLDPTYLEWGSRTGRPPPHVDDYSLVELINRNYPPEPLLVETAADDSVVFVYQECRSMCFVGLGAATADGKQLKNRVELELPNYANDMYLHTVGMMDSNRDGTDEVWIQYSTIEGQQYREYGRLAVFAADASLAPLWSGEVPLNGADPCSGEVAITDVDCNGNPDLVITQRCCTERYQGYCNGPQNEATRTAYWWNEGSTAYDELEKVTFTDAEQYPY